MNLKMFYSQRNMYLTGFTLFLAMYPFRPVLALMSWIAS